MDPRRQQLLGWIDETRRLQRRLGLVFAALAIVAFGLLFYSRTLGGFALFGVAVIALCSFWVTESHNAAHRQKLDELSRTHGKPVHTDHRRWNSQSRTLPE